MSHTVRYHELAQIERIATRFADCTLPCAEWTHEAHLTVGLWYLRDHPTAEALDLVRLGIRRYNGSCGVENSATGGYHETLTRFYLAIIGRYLNAVTDRSDWVAVTNHLIAELGARDLPLGYYSRERLMSSAARAAWVAPDLRPLD